MMKYVSLILSLFLLSGCGVKTIRVVDGEGRPVAGALVISQKEPYIAQAWEIAAYETDAEGKAIVVSGNGYILKPGYFPVIDGDDIGNEKLWSYPRPFSETTSIYRITEEPRVRVQESYYTTEMPIAKDTFAVPLPVCEAKKMEYTVKDSVLTVHSEARDIRPSEGFFFIGVMGNESLSTLKAVDDIAFYCHDQGALYKVGVSVLGKVTLLGRPHHRLVIFTARVPTINTPIYPRLKCMSEQDISIFKIGDYRKGRPRVYASPDVKKRIQEIAPRVPCANEYSDKLFEYVEKYL